MVSVETGNILHFFNTNLKAVVGETEEIRSRQKISFEKS